jgi:hypothetical protein
VDVSDLAIRLYNDVAVRKVLGRISHMIGTKTECAKSLLTFGEKKQKESERLCGDTILICR